MSVSNVEPARDTSTDGSNRRERQRLETRERLYETAIAEFRSVGFNAAQIDRIAEKSGFARGTFYFHFPTKKHVLVELQHRIELSAEPVIVLVVDYFADAAERGAVRRDIAPEQTAVLFLSSLFTVYMGDSPFRTETGNHSNLAIDIFVRGIAPNTKP